MAGTRRSARALRPRLELLLDPDSALTLQHQVRQKLIDAMSRGVLRPGRRLPSSRELARQAGIARNTVTLAYDALLAAGHLVSRPRSGIFVAPQPPAGRLTTGRRGLSRPAQDPGRAAAAAAQAGEFRRPPNWEQYPYPFLDGCVDASLVPADEWREALRIAFGKRDLLRWGGGTEPLDDARLNAELREQVLPGWGIEAAADELLCAASARHALHLVIDCFAGRQTPVWVETSVDTDTRRRLGALQAQLVPFDLGAAGSRTLEELPSQSLVIIGPRSAPDDVPLTRARAQGLIESVNRTGSILVECTAAPPDVREPRRAAPALRAMAPQPRVLMIGTLSQVAALGSALAFISGGAELIERLRESRRLSGSGVPLGMQRAWGYFIGLGHYAAATAHASAVLQERRVALRDALNHHLHRFVSIHTRAGASAYWVRGGAQIEAAELARRAATVGILVEPVDAGAGLLCMGVTSIPRAKIRAGIERLARLVRGDPRSGPGDLRQEAARVLRGRTLQRAMAGITLLYSTVYGEPCTIEVRPDGELVGRAGYADEDRDVGRWWTEDDRWFRQWNSWAYGEVSSYYTVIDGDQVRWFNSEGQLADTAVIARAARPAR